MPDKPFYETEYFKILRRAYCLNSKRVRDGDLPPVTTQQCTMCGKQAAAYHHPDYDYLNLVTPLCRKCHRRLHTPATRRAALERYG